ncbi:hypothetical protein CKAN_02425600 [Cinnamomum micranthum f. kanehirae]|uniref:Tf2-1-like SH3-like domain-containing protein n=1 Tax=Cinnamomum micranthum f. kanehirae TaxID=337451 RepID=A0A3S3N2Z0_9MAGN|nr:hypothetical protein CKAN_02425600 [Cinnamomum micranthum f. kanehirae]
MWEDVEEYVRTCLVCQQDKVERKKQAGLLEPLPGPERPWAFLEKAAKRIKKCADHKRRPLEFKEGDKVINVLPQQFKASRKVHKGLVRRYEGPFPILQNIGNVSYKLQLSAWLKIHPIFHVSHLKPYHEDMEDPSSCISHCTPMFITETNDKNVSSILAKREERQGGPVLKKYT